MGPASFSSLHLWVSGNDMQQKMLKISTGLKILIAAGSDEVGTLRNDGNKIKFTRRKEEMEEFLDLVLALGGPGSGEKHWNNYFSTQQMGSYRIGATPDEEQATDGNGETWEAEGLSVCHGSVLPSAIGVKPMITIESTTYCLSKKIAES
ncbi:hypothetical protein NE237_012271 [Protea cynaroides]|uniref:Glucose-methanol-choline oxidoreductase C-terminal domain-containing protein n=1 Tax=Protea cynaroides TaxID=273540 RepID=A0A9Q0JZ30_9MAGN|nr:hypothetical protein NE237_012271 [Protea cynaroides]